MGEWRRITKSKWNNSSRSWPVLKHRNSLRHKNSPIKELDLMNKILNKRSSRMLSRHFKTQDNIFQTRNKAKIKFLNGIKNSKQAGLNPFTYYYIFHFEMYAFCIYVYTASITAPLVNVRHTDIDKKNGCQIIVHWSFKAISVPYLGTLMPITSHDYERAINSNMISQLRNYNKR
jgi:hypothetical protein